MTQTTIALGDFMKKKFHEKSHHEPKTSHSQTKKQDGDEAMDEAEQEQKKLRIAKNQSNQKAANYNKFEMYKQLFIQCVIGYLALLAAVVILVLACIFIGPAIMSFFQLIIHKLVLLALRG